MANNYLTIGEVLTHLLKYEGATVKRDGKRFEIITYDDGYQVSLETDHDRVFPLDDIYMEELEQGLMNAPEGQEFGLWIDLEDNKQDLYIDYKSVHFDDIDKAIEVAKKHNQLAIFDWERLDSIYIT